MFDIGWQELFIVAVLAVIVVGPRDLPRVLKTVMHWVRKARGLAREFQSSIDEVAREVELDEIKNQATRIANADFDKEMEQMLDPSGSINEDLDMSAVEKSIQETAEQMNVDPKAHGPAKQPEHTVVDGIPENAATDAADSTAATTPDPSPDEFDADDDFFGPDEGDGEVADDAGGDTKSTAKEASG